MKKITLSFLICFVALFFYTKASAQTLDLSNFKMTPDTVKTVTLNDGMKGSFCPVDLGITGKELLDSNIRDENFKLPDNIQSAPCKGDTEDVIFAMVNVGLTKPVQDQSSVGLFLTLFKDHLFQQNGHARRASAYYPDRPQTFSLNFLNGGEEGNTPPYGNPKWLKYEMDRDFLEMDSSSKEGFKTNPDSGYIIHFDPEGKRQEFLFIFEGKIYKLVKAEKKRYNTVIVDYSQRIPQSTESSANTTNTTTSNNSAVSTDKPPTTNGTPTTQTSDVIIISSNMTYAGYPSQSVHYNITLPKAGGDISGNFSGLCNGSINGRYDGGEGGSMLGRAWGSCDIPFLDHAVNISYTGTVWPKEGKMDIDWLSHDGITGERQESFTQNFIPQPNIQSNTSYQIEAQLVCARADEGYAVDNHVDLIYQITVNGGAIPFATLTLTDNKTKDVFDFANGGPPGNSTISSWGGTLHWKLRDRDNKKMIFTADGRDYTLKLYKLTTVSEAVTQDLQPVAQKTFFKICEF